METEGNTDITCPVCVHLTHFVKVPSRNKKLECVFQSAVHEFSKCLFYDLYFLYLHIRGILLTELMSDKNTTLIKLMDSRGNSCTDA
jgi:hypothetical protein